MNFATKSMLRSCIARYVVFYSPGAAILCAIILLVRVA